MRGWDGRGEGERQGTEEGGEEKERASSTHLIFIFIFYFPYILCYNSEEESSREGRAAPDFDWDAAKAGDGNLPGGVDPEALQKLTSSQEMMEIMSNPRLQVRSNWAWSKKQKCAGGDLLPSYF